MYQNKTQSYRICLLLTLSHSMVNKFELKKIVAQLIKEGRRRRSRKDLGGLDSRLRSSEQRQRWLCDAVALRCGGCAQRCGGSALRGAEALQDCDAVLHRCEEEADG